MRKHPWLTAAAILAVLGGLLYFYVEWHAEKRWQRYATEARVRGVKLYYADFNRPEIPEAQNFAELPMLKKALAGEKDAMPFKLPKRPRSTQSDGGKKSSFYDDGSPPFGDSKPETKIDWKEWQKYFLAVGFLTETSDDPVRDTLRGIEHYEPQFREWSEWRTTRPQFWLPISPTNGQRLPVTTLTQASMLFHLRMAAHLAAGDSTAAYADFQDSWQASRVMQANPGLVNGILRAGTLQYLLEAWGKGARDHAWADAELQKIDHDLASLQLWDDYCECLAGGRCEINREIEKVMNLPLRERAQFQNDAGNLFSSRTAILAQVTPRSLFRDNQWRMNRYLDELTVPGGATGQTFNPDRHTPSSPQNIVSSYDKDYYFLCVMAGDAYEVLERTYMRLQILLDEARLACALERFYLARKVYPETLLELVPEFIPAVPTDIYAGAPYHYQRMGEASYRLYGVGENRKDDGGKVGPGLPKGQQPDAVWSYAPAEAKGK